MRLYLLRHAEASYDAASDRERELTPKGERSIHKLCGRLRSKEFEQLPVICHSTLVRARQTAEIFREQLAQAAPLQEVQGLAPMDDPTSLTEYLLEAREDRMFVGHNPHLSILAAWLLAGNPSADVIDFKKSGLLCLERGSPPSSTRPAGVWVMNWYLVKRPFSE